MKEENQLIDKFGREGPWTVPDGYFDAVRVEIESKLPEYTPVAKRQELSLWQRVKPYVYLAAMFAGIWCMMKVFHHASGGGRLSLDNPPEHIAAYMGEMEAEDMLVLPVSDSDLDLIDDVSGQYSSFDDFQRDFGYEFQPQYAKIEL